MFEINFNWIHWTIVDNTNIFLSIESKPNLKLAFSTSEISTDAEQWKRESWITHRFECMHSHSVGVVRSLHSVRNVTDRCVRHESHTQTHSPSTALVIQKHRNFINKCTTVACSHKPRLPLSLCIRCTTDDIQTLTEKVVFQWFAQNTQNSVLLLFLIAAQLIQRRETHEYRHQTIENKIEFINRI